MLNRVGDIGLSREEEFHKNAVISLKFETYGLGEITESPQLQKTKK